LRKKKKKKKKKEEKKTLKWSGEVGGEVEWDGTEVVIDGVKW